MVIAQVRVLTSYYFDIHYNSYLYKNIFKVQGF